MSLVESAQNIPKVPSTNLRRATTTTADTKVTEGHVFKKSEKTMIWHKNQDVYSNDTNNIGLILVWYFVSILWVQYVAHYIVLNNLFFGKWKKYTKYCIIVNEKWWSVNKNIHKIYNLSWLSCLVLKNQSAGLKLIKLHKLFFFASPAAFPFLFVNLSIHHCIHFPFSKQNVKKWGVVQHFCTVLYVKLLAHVRHLVFA